MPAEYLGQRTGLNEEELYRLIQSTDPSSPEAGRRIAAMLDYPAVLRARLATRVRFDRIPLETTNGTE